MACVDICQKNAIKIKDSLRAYNAVIDESQCLKCNACHRVCPECHIPNLRQPIYWKEGWAEDSEIRTSSSSGGFATAIELFFVRNIGVVCSCTFKNGEFIFSFARSEEEVKKYTGSKYVKSNPVGAYKKILRYLKEGISVLFVGLPCQVAAVKNYTGDPINLYCIDLICHGTPSPAILEAFLNEHQCSLRNLKDIKFREKDHFGVIKDQMLFTVSSVRDNYTTAFLNSTSYTENCYKCQYARLERISDLTLGDSWGSGQETCEQHKGISLALAQTEKGWELLKRANLHMLDLDLENAVENNHQLCQPSVMPAQREMFFEMLEDRVKFSQIIFKCYPNRFIKDLVKTLLYKLKIPRG